MTKRHITHAISAIASYMPLWHIVIIETRRTPMRKSTIAKEAGRQLAFLGEMLKEDNWNGNAVKFHANSASNYIKSIREGGLELPPFVNTNRNFLKAMGWTI